ncbi:MAG: RsmD family RNA methyltransferase [Myxococcota bacterium]
MGLRITGGSARGRVLRGDVPSGIRPTGSRVREALFSVVGQDLEGVRFLDAFAGSGIMALEAWSRGAEVVAVEKNPRSAGRIKGLCAELGAVVEVRVGDVTRVADGLGTFGVVYADPPFALDPAPLLEALAPCVEGVLFLEADRKTAVPETVAHLRRSRVREFGNVVVHELRSPR